MNTSGLAGVIRDLAASVRVSANLSAQLVDVDVRGVIVTAVLERSDDFWNAPEDLPAQRWREFAGVLDGVIAELSADWGPATPLDVLSSVAIGHSSEGLIGEGEPLKVALFDRCVPAGSMWTDVERSAAVIVGLGQCDEQMPIEMIVAVRRAIDRRR